MKEELDNNKDYSLYTFYSAKKIYLTHTPSSFLLVEKKTENYNSGVLSLSSRNTVVISGENGILLFPKNKRS